MFERGVKTSVLNSDRDPLSKSAFCLLLALATETIPIIHLHLGNQA